ncbi:dihydrofolate reductase type I [Candidatus Blochmanniella floridana]|uniref:dihydrofolate reductase n=1 Tax=Blochmanniella floridana TaxID=203907 RepID=Q7VQK5_BLOFL|nr:dihydrofolate reductase type I [Candidatus Blochmannia floridanus]
MIISLIAAFTINYVIGRKNIIPWYFSWDMMWFKYHTMYKPVIMGRKTFESMNSKPLPYRLNIVLSKHHILYNNKIHNIFIACNPIQALSVVQKNDEVMIIGGGLVYNAFMSQCTRMYLTKIDVVYNYGDSWFPSYNPNEWCVVYNTNKKCVINTGYTYNLNFQILDRT